MWKSKKHIGLGLLLTVCVAGFFWSPLSAKSTEAPIHPKTVAAIKVQRTDLSRTVSLTAELRPWQEIDIHAKVSGYLKAITVDIGDQVKQGQVIATLDLPEQQQDQTKAAADFRVAKLDYDRIEAVIKKQPGLLAQDEVDKARAVYEEAKATYERMKILSDYAVIAAPFDGVITKRFADPGALVQAGTTSNTQAMPLVHLAEISKLRLDLPVPESLAAQIKVGMPVNVTLQASQASIPSHVARLSDSVDATTRTMAVEVDIDNSDLSLKPGLYATALLELDAKQNALAAPMQAIASSNKPNVWVINAENKIEEHPVTLGIQTPDKVEIMNGVSEGDLLLYGNRSESGIGMTVTPKLIDTDSK